MGERWRHLEGRPTGARIVGATVNESDPNECGAAFAPGLTRAPTRQKRQSPGVRACGLACVARGSIDQGTGGATRSRTGLDGFAIARIKHLPALTAVDRINANQQLRHVLLDVHTVSVLID